MAKKIKFPLKLNSADCRTLSEIRENWNINEVYVYFVDGRLLTWCKDRHYIQADKIAELSTEDSDARKKLCEIFEVEYVAGDSNSDDWRPKTPEEVEKYNRLKNYTADEEILKKFRQVAFDRDELDDLIDDYDEIYLCNNIFEEFPISVENRKYIGIGKVTVKIPSQKPVDFDKKNIKFLNVEFDDDYTGVGENLPDKWFQIADEAEKNKDYAKAIEYYSKAVEKNHIKAMNYLASMYLEGNGIKKDEVKAFELFQKAAELGNAVAMYLAGIMYLQGRGTPQIVYKGINLLEKAAELGNIDAMISLGNVYRNGECEVTADKKIAFKWYLKAAEVDNAEAMNNVGFMYDNGEGVAQNSSKAMEWYKKAADLGNAVAMYNIGYFYSSMNNFEQAVYWLKKATEHGDSKAINRLGMIYQSVFGDYQTALKYYRQGTDQGNADSMYNLGYLYHEGLGVNKDDKIALEWLEKAKAKGHPHAEELIKKIKNCFITTAVCESFNKPDDCFELTTFRNFRDNWLALQSDGKILIAEYYKIAPQIVANINKLTNASEIYKKLWNDWLAPCLEFIKVGDNVACKNKYVEMVNRLKKLYL